MLSALSLILLIVIAGAIIIEASIHYAIYYDNDSDQGAFMDAFMPSKQARRL